MELKKQKRCHWTECRKKVYITDWECKCGYKFCKEHKSMMDHECPYLTLERDEHRKKLQSSLVDAKFIKLQDSL